MAYIDGLEGYRQKAGLSQNALARMAGVDRATISRAENQYNIRTEKAHLILRALNSTSEYSRNKIPPEKIIDGGKSGVFPKTKNKKKEATPEEYSVE